MSLTLWMPLALAVALPSHSLNSFVDGAAAPQIVPIPPSNGVIVGKPSEGMSSADFFNRFGYCFNSFGIFMTPIGQGSVFTLNDIPLCQKQLSELNSKFVFIHAGVVQSISTVGTRYKKGDVDVPVETIAAAPAPAPHEAQTPGGPAPTAVKNRKFISVLPDATPPPPPPETLPQDPNLNPNAVNK